MIYIRHEQQYFCNSYSSRNKCALDVETLTAILTETKKDDLDLSSISESLDFLNDASRGVILVRSSIGRASGC